MLFPELRPRCSVTGVIGLIDLIYTVNAEVINNSVYKYFDVILSANPLSP